MRSLLFVSLLAKGFAGGGLLYHWAGLGVVARGDDANVNGLVDDARLAGARLACLLRRNLVVVVLTCTKYSNENHYRERDEKQHHFEQRVPLDGRTVGRQRKTVPLVLNASYWRSRILPSRVPPLGIYCPGPAATMSFIAVRSEFPFAMFWPSLGRRISPGASCQL